MSSVVSSVPEIDALPSGAVVRSSWFEVSERDLSVWNDILLGTTSSLYQYPFWNEPHRPLWLTPKYLAWGTQDQPSAYACILTVGFGSLKIGMVFRGPVPLQPTGILPHAAIDGLLDWARSEGYVFIRFTHEDPQILCQLAAAGHAENLDAFPYFLDYSTVVGDYVVEQCESDDDTLATFDREARRKIRRATELGYEFRYDDSPETLASAWALYQECACRKRFRLERPLSVYMEMIRQARPHHCVRIYSACFDGKVVGSAVVYRDRATAHCQLAAFHNDHRHSAAFLHWHAMRDMYRLGALRYNLGPGPGTLARFKEQFCERPVTYPGALTIVLKEDWFYFWWKVVYPVARRLRPTLRKVISRVRR